ncbi:flagellar basal body P-ring formation chaperone FlgA [Devosia sp.]|uniref:flagellar basal body P-ring formation chaperone FlgA n=1 Tax=Devosia sp. TaxID=1871048 RepID=UPI0035B20413
MRFTFLTLPLVATLLLTSIATAAPMLRAEVSVVGEVVTVGDMFDGAGLLAERALFRAPAPGTSGLVGLDAIRRAAARAGLAEYSEEGVMAVRVERQVSVVVDGDLSALIAADLHANGLVPVGATVSARFDAGAISLNAEAVETPARLVTLRYRPGAAGFAARFQIAGLAAPLDLTGTLSMLVETPHLAASLKAGTVLTPSDIELRRVPFDFADQSGVETIADLVGKELKRNTRAGVMLKLSDVGEPLAVRRNTEVTVLLRSGPMTLTVVGQALGDAEIGEPVQVMNTVTRKILNGVAVSAGTVEIATAATKLTVAGL